MYFYKKGQGWVPVSLNTRDCRGKLYYLEVRKPEIGERFFELGTDPSSDWMEDGQPGKLCYTHAEIYNLDFDRLGPYYELRPSRHYCVITLI